MHLSTAQVAPEERSAFWTDLVCSVFVSLDCRPLGCPAMEGEIRSERVGDAVVSQVTSVGQRVDRTVSRIRQGGDGFVLVSLQLA
ncbi:MAG TPA: hypothetical protein VK943_02695, partial [Arenibaculum sp.]|nr:hypothetical protein [Arenibaculum sp.]